MLVGMGLPEEVTVGKADGALNSALGANDSTFVDGASVIKLATVGDAEIGNAVGESPSVGEIVCDVGTLEIDK